MDFEQLSPAAQREIAEKLGGRRIYIPTVQALDRRVRRRQSVTLLNGDSTYSEVAAELGVSVSTVVRDAKCFTGST